MTTAPEYLLPAEIVTTMQDSVSARLQLRGEFDLAVSPLLHDVLHAHLDAGRGDLLLDGREVTFADASAVGVLAGTVCRCRDTGGTLALSGSSTALTRILTLTGLDTVLPVRIG